ncbi:uncharacterized protein HKW66_Vig0059190 [Vigna angularis]|uniref:Uncharacterized protein n=1 Tax=Phaseolus angularis TaxID=3914 RepID=A0A8T0L544_PHAAN|nr:uncharacterized protein HKW66_Vig0059190 [Vigna angularis]
MPPLPLPRNLRSELSFLHLWVEKCPTSTLTFMNNIDRVQFFSFHEIGSSSRRFKKDILYSFDLTSWFSCKSYSLSIFSISSDLEEKRIKRKKVAIRSKSQSNKSGCNVYSELENGVANLSRGWKNIDEDDN